MRACHVLIVAVIAVLTCSTVERSSGVDLAAAVASTTKKAVASGLVVAGGSGRGVTVTADDLAKLPAVQVGVSFETGHGRRQASFNGPLLWTVLDHAGAIDATKPREQVRQVVLVTGRDGYMAALSLGEIAPEFESKQVILAEQMDGQPLGPEHLRLVVPGDRRGGRSVRDVVRITVTAPQDEQR